ncbi:AAA family ATPase [Chondromyces apiculatus]|uniref:Weak D-galactarate dehydratase/altronate hydrolase domain protein n=1 Tax=Chondromyces apiculatus DSM 436 TaxID=1192034 RepID=A0A017TBU9_9BACT|nr:AAA family ATPase [Chondromyces apiculatus]EYF06768.1 weak D-galactarate dehydratase/altronate hydrolase domain protein [Chondromyces apiculatus DSM 436]
MRHKVRVPIGIDDFRKVRELGLEYVDKTHLALELLDKEGVEVLLLPRPRRFGKTLNLSMLRCFFEKQPEDLSPLFQGLRVWEAGAPYRAHFQRYPVIHLTLKDLKFLSWEACWEAIKKKITMLYGEHRAALAGLTGADARWAQEILDGTASLAIYAGALADLSRYLHAHHGERVVILIDEYDKPIHTGYFHGYQAQAVEFFRAFLAGGLKGNPHLFKAVLTGILRVARGVWGHSAVPRTTPPSLDESIFSGLNNLGVYSLLQRDFNTCFGFTEAEVLGLLEKTQGRDRLEPLRAWYNGYVFGGEVIYNPWSVLNFLASESEEPAPYWLSTSSNDLVRELLEQRALEVEPVFEELLAGGSIEQVLDESVPLGEVQASKGALWSLLVFAGYLRAERRSRGPMDEAPHLLSIPNREVRKVYTDTFRGWMASSLRACGGDLDLLIAALLAGDAEGLQRQLEAFIENVLSYHDIPARSPELVYQAFIVGLLASLEGRYEVRSNRESGLGRADVLVKPRQAGQPGAVLELKVIKPARRRPDKALAEGLAQVQRLDYAAALHAAGAVPIHLFAVAFDGKQVWVRAMSAGPARKAVKKAARGASTAQTKKRRS